MKNILILIVLTIGLTGCSHSLNSYNLRDRSDIYMNFFVYETLNLLKKEKSPGRIKFVITSSNDKGKFINLFVKQLREIGYSIKEIPTNEVEGLKFEADECLISFYIDYVNLIETEDDGVYIGLQLLIGNATYSKLYKSDDISDIPISVGNWSVKS